MRPEDEQMFFVHVCCSIIANMLWSAMVFLSSATLSSHMLFILSPSLQVFPWSCRLLRVALTAPASLSHCGKPKTSDAVLIVSKWLLCLQDPLTAAGRFVFKVDKMIYLMLLIWDLAVIYCPGLRSPSRLIEFSGRGGNKKRRDGSGNTGAFQTRYE